MARAIHSSTVPGPRTPTFLSSRQIAPDFRHRRGLQPRRGTDRIARAVVSL